MLAGLITVPQELLEAADDRRRRAPGSGSGTITVPLLKPVFAVVTILSTIWDFKVFTQIYLMPGGNGTNRDVLNLGVCSYVKALSPEPLRPRRRHRGDAHRVLLVITAVYLRVVFRQEEL